MLLNFCIAFPATIFFYAASYVVAVKLFPHTNDIYFTADAVFGVVYYPLLVWLAFDATYQLAWDKESRWFGSTNSSRWLAVAITSRMTFHLIFLLRKKMSKQERAIFVIHHCFCIAVYGCGYINDKCHFWGAFTAMCEITNVFLTFLELYMSSKRKGEVQIYMHDVVPHPKKKMVIHQKQKQNYRLSNKTRLFKTNSVLLCLSYAIFRIILFPVFLGLWLYDVYSHPEMTWKHPDMGLMERYMYPFTAMLMLVLSINWFFPIYNGMLKTLGYRISSQKMRELIPEGYHEHVM
uniref:TLC domain-containing protein n=1 Tax=Aplanochytrium stocchinoi TaxID=215587 RepID=A0A7S3V0G7_9STRA